jgi:hypothetical protein
VNLSNISFALVCILQWTLKRLKLKRSFIKPFQKICQEWLGLDLKQHGADSENAAEDDRGGGDGGVEVMVKGSEGIRLVVMMANTYRHGGHIGSEGQ